MRKTKYYFGAGLAQPDPSPHFAEEKFVKKFVKICGLRMSLFRVATKSLSGNTQLKRGGE